MKALRSLSLLALVLTASSCSAFLTHRDYLAEMEHDDSSFYNPSDDFPVVAGDTGRMYETESERRLRTPASAHEYEQDQSKRLLTSELRTLENKQSEGAREYYEKYKHRLPSTSERIYFLKLSHYERQEYLDSRGLLESNRRPASVDSEYHHSASSSITMGMSKDEVVNNFGKPSRVEVAGNPSFENERWLYNVNGASKYIYFESGRVGGWE